MLLNNQYKIEVFLLLQFSLLHPHSKTTNSIVITSSNQIICLEPSRPHIFPIPQVNHLSQFLASDFSKANKWSIMYVKLSHIYEPKWLPIPPPTPSPFPRPSQTYHCLIQNWHSHVYFTGFSRSLSLSQGEVWGTWLFKWHACGFVFTDQHY